MLDIKQAMADFTRLRWQKRTTANDNCRHIDRVTNEMIAKAKEYPWEALIDIRHNMAICPFHEDKHPSMLIKNNYAWCFSCSQSWDQIDFIMQKDGLSFKSAVKKLQN